MPDSTVQGFLNTILFGSGTTNSNTGNSMQRTVGTTATVGLSLFLLRFVVQAAKAAAEENGDAVEGRSEVLYEFVRSILRRMIAFQRGGKLLQDEGSEEDNAPMIHHGSCHCRAVCFELIAPQKIRCKESQPGKIQYRYARIRAKSFRFVKGTAHVNMYYVNKPQSPQNGNEEVGAHSFCSQCGVTFLHAPNSHSTKLDVNVDCLDQKNVKLKVETGPRINLAAGLPVIDQWDQDGDLNSYGYPATIAEENPSIAFNKSSPFSAYKHHPLMRPHNQHDWNLSDYRDDGTIDLVFPGKVEPDTPSTVYSTQTESFVSSATHSGVPPTLTLDTSNNDAESLVSLSSARSSFAKLPSTSISLGRGAMEPSFGILPSPPSNAVISPATTPLVRHQMNRFMRKHMSTSSSISSSSSRLSPQPRAVQRAKSASFHDTTEQATTTARS